VSPVIKAQGNLCIIPGKVLEMNNNNNININNISQYLYAV